MFKNLEFVLHSLFNLVNCLQMSLLIQAYASYQVHISLHDHCNIEFMTSYSHVFSYFLSYSHILLMSQILSSAVGEEYTRVSVGDKSGGKDEGNF